ncbi:hypothetical protein FOXG_19645 [Fusarium oxysporum f. sp. lycopersici 4287]|uniref:Membrane anchor Opy2 N-terminal domain-containing protein n=1 Tax=Fusarium oxysporum f. sp. lycopersici (strain 4287 / CBS 123668 / FGSC 9935 / NRRL 34936) TaxID=426428 RepID=A0A0J9V4C1_FUSO4|nr:hypothetical protein FOXG_19645 [Fusarium oxysporum f. sp. lycopersici 4287]KAJ9419543.1 hypothetical protein QL093DRAFT_2015529 [Fusarium oxysporum]KNB06359.1 hypothetical protein FOXG_19645 [Fusarium oxysporum f. sp. lycopersici 4287]
MGVARYIGARAWDDLSRILTLIPQGNDGINCDNSTRLQCLECSGGESCQYTVPLYCAQCATSPSRREAEAESHKGGSGLTTGGIIGGIIGSIVIISVATYLVWRFYIKLKRPQTPASIHIEAVDPIPSSENDAASGGGFSRVETYSSFYDSHHPYSSLQYYPNRLHPRRYQPSGSDVIKPHCSFCTADPHASRRGQTGSWE